MFSILRTQVQISGLLSLTNLLLIVEIFRFPDSIVKTLGCLKIFVGWFSLKTLSTGFMLKSSNHFWLMGANWNSPFIFFMLMPIYFALNTFALALIQRFKDNTLFIAHFNPITHVSVCIFDPITTWLIYKHPPFVIFGPLSLVVGQRGFRLLCLYFRLHLEIGMIFECRVYMLAFYEEKSIRFALSGLLYLFET